jgi:dTDP-4-dehydrorhamnose reductase
MRIAVTGRNGQVTRALQALDGVEVVALARPELDLVRPETILPALRDANADVIVNAAAYTAVDRAETDEAAAFACNEAGAGAVAAAAAVLKKPIIHLSTDYVFDGAKRAPYVEADAPNPINVYGRSKLAGEHAVAAAHDQTVILRLSWIYGPHGANFVRTMLRLAADREEVAVVDDQRGMPMASPDIATAIATIARNLDAGAGYGLFHASTADSATWADFADAIFAGSHHRGGPSARVRRISSAEFGAAAARPADSRMRGAHLEAVHGVALPGYSASLDACVASILRG